jgi:RNA recognition motif-containing protein
VDIPTGRQGRSRGYGIVEYSNVNEAQVAIQTLDGA